MIAQRALNLLCVGADVAGLLCEKSTTSFLRLSGVFGCAGSCAGLCTVGRRPMQRAASAYAARCISCSPMRYLSMKWANFDVKSTYSVPFFSTALVGVLW